MEAVRSDLATVDAFMFADLNLGGNVPTFRLRFDIAAIGGSEVVLGAPFFEDHSIGMDWAKHTLTFPRQAFPQAEFYANEPVDGYARYVAIKSATLHPNEVMAVFDDQEETRLRARKALLSGEETTTEREDNLDPPPRLQLHWR
jgi:hypothetical protein